MLLQDKQMKEKGLTFKNCAPFTTCRNGINNTEIDNAKDIDIVMLMYNLIEYTDNYSKTPGNLWQQYKDDPNDCDNYSKTSGSLFQYLKDIPNDNLARSELFKSKVKITGKTSDDGNTQDVEIIVPLNI